MRLDGIPLVVNTYLCEHRFLRWRRTHRKKRIAKKWQKRYGAVFAPCPAKMYQVAGVGIVTCPHGQEMLRRSLGQAGR